MNIKGIVFLLAIVVGTSQAWSQATRKYSNEFLKIGVGGRYLGLGGAVAAGEDDPTAVFYNPSALSTISSTSISAMHNSYFAGIANFDYAGIAIPIKENQTVAASFIRMGIDNIPNTINLYNADGTINYDNIQEFSVSDMALFLSFAKKVKDTLGLSLGGNLKIIHRSYGSFGKAWGFGVDIGAQIVGEKYRIGVFAQDLTTTFSTWSFSFTDEEKKVLQATNNEIPSSSSEITLPSFHIGGQYSFSLAKGKVGITPLAKLSAYSDKRNVLIAGPLSLDASLGLETKLFDIAFLRFGASNFTKATNVLGEEYLSFMPSLGVGVKFNQFDIDYSYNNIGNAGIGLYSHVFSGVFRFKKKEKKYASPTTLPTVPNIEPILENEFQGFPEVEKSKQPKETPSPQTNPADEKK